MEDLKTHIIIVAGTLKTGFEFYGPFKTPQEAERWAERNLSETTWDIHLMYKSTIFD